MSAASDFNVAPYLPTSYKHEIVSLEAADTLSCGTKNFNSVVRCSVFTQEQFLEWLEEFKYLPATDWIVSQTYPNPQRLEYKVIYECHHSNRNKTVTAKFRARGVNCKAKIICTVKKNNKFTRQRFCN